MCVCVFYFIIFIFMTDAYRRGGMAEIGSFFLVGCDPGCVLGFRVLGSRFWCVCVCVCVFPIVTDA